MSLASAYLWLKALHIISVIAWMAGLLYLPRLFVYHADAPVGSATSETLKVMEAKLARFIMLPAMIATLIFGALLLGGGVIDPTQGWLHVKILLVFGLVGFQHFLGRWRRAFAEDRNTRSAKFFRMINEVPTLAMIVIVILVVVKPF